MKIRIALLFLILASLACMEPVIVTPTPTANDIITPTPAADNTPTPTPPPTATSTAPQLSDIFPTATATATPQTTGEGKGAP